MNNICTKCGSLCNGDLCDDCRDDLSWEGCQGFVQGDGWSKPLYDSLVKQFEAYTLRQIRKGPLTLSAKDIEFLKSCNVRWS